MVKTSTTQKLCRLTGELLYVFYEHHLRLKATMHALHSFLILWTEHEVIIINTTINNRYIVNKCINYNVVIYHS